ncbi:MAG: hypothetical protein AAGB35_00520 [Pseudomonadota bacterium]
MSSSTEAPQCSTLRRHWESAKAMESKPSSSTPSSTSSSSSNSGGFFGWLKSLFS